MNCSAKSPGGDHWFGFPIWARQARSLFWREFLGRDGNARIIQACATHGSGRRVGGAATRRCAGFRSGADYFHLHIAEGAENISAAGRKLQFAEPVDHLGFRWRDGSNRAAGSYGYARTGRTDRGHGSGGAGGACRAGRGGWGGWGRWGGGG